jgi:hypothetical protein
MSRFPVEGGAAASVAPLALLRRHPYWGASAEDARRSVTA